jgi:hypothetical protein
MAIKIFGGAYAIHVVPGSARTRRERNGLEQGECVFSCKGEPYGAGLILQGARPLGGAHPYNGRLWMEQQELVYGADGAEAVCSYAGVNYENLEKPSYELIIGMEEQPISTHPKFLTIAGKPSAPVNGALFIDPSTGYPSADNTLAVFDSFYPYVDGSLNRKAGIESYLDAVMTYRENYVSYSLPHVSGFGEISGDVPGPGFRGSLGRRNWLYVGFTYRRRGDPSGVVNRVVYEISREWKLSGRNGWDTQIYTS